jgi:hypothetical protein
VAALALISILPGLKAIQTTSGRIIHGSVCGGVAVLGVALHILFKRCSVPQAQEEISIDVLHLSLQNACLTKEDRRSALHALSENDFQKYITYFQAQTFDSPAGALKTGRGL